jgi:hypothetical protein
MLVWDNVHTFRNYMFRTVELNLFLPGIVINYCVEFRLG